MMTDHTDRSLWHIPSPVLGGRTLYESMSGVGSSTYDVDTYIAGGYGDELMRHALPVLNFTDAMDPELLAYWRSRGLEKHFHKGSERARDWVCYVPLSASLPENAGKKYPAFYLHWEEAANFLDMERWGFADLAADNELIIICAQNGRRDDVFNATLDAAIAAYPVDPERIYLYGHSFTAVCSGLHGINFIDRIAGIAMSGSQYYGADSSPEQIGYAERVGMPVIFIHCMKQSRCLLPFSYLPEHPMSPVRFDTVITRSPFTPNASYAEQIFWRKINRCPLFPLSAMQDLHLRAENICEQKLGIPLEHTYIRELGGLPHYFGDVYNEDNVCALRFVAVEHGNHFTPAYAAALAWQFLRSFRRDSQTHLSVCDPAPAWPDPLADVPVQAYEHRPSAEALWDVHQASIGNVTARQLVCHHAAPDFDFDAYVSGENGQALLAQMRPHLLYGGEGEEPALAMYWARRGLTRTIHDGEHGAWVSYTPAQSADRPVLCLLKNRRHRFSEPEMWGFAQLAAREQLVLLVIERSNDEAAVRGILTEALAQYGADAARVFLCGHSYTGAVAGRLSLAMADVVAGVCILGAQYNGEDTTIDEFDRAKRCRMPRVDIHGMAMESGLLPYNVSPNVPMPAKYAANVSVSDYSALPGFEEQRFWRDINNCPAAGQLDQITGSGKDADRAFERMVADNRARLARMTCIQTESDDPVEQALGFFCDQTEVQVLDGMRYFIGDAIDRDGAVMLRTVGVENAPLLPAPRAAELAWDFLRRFSRAADGTLEH